MAERFTDEQLLEWLGLATRQGPISKVAIADANGWDRGDVDAALRKLEVENPPRVRRWPKAISAMVNPDADDDDMVDGWTLAGWALPPELGGQAGPREGEIPPPPPAPGPVDPPRPVAADTPPADAAGGPDSRVERLEEGAAALREGAGALREGAAALRGPDVPDDETHANSRLADALDFEPLGGESDPELLERLGTDPRAWAREFVARFRSRTVGDGWCDEGLFLGWFANAIGAGRDEAIRTDQEKIRAIAFESAGAASVPFMKAMPDFVMPTEEITAAVSFILLEHGIHVPPLRGETPDIGEILTPPGRERALSPSEDDALTVDGIEGDALLFLPDGPRQITHYLDESIRLWRRRAQMEETAPDGLVDHAREMAEANSGRELAAALAALYVDAFQSVRSSLVGTPLPPEDQA